MTTKTKVSESKLSALIRAIPDLSVDDLSRLITTGLEAQQNIYGFNRSAETVVNWLGSGVTREGCEILSGKINAHILDVKRCEEQTHA